MGISAERWRRGPIIGRGATATVFLASSSSASEPFAVKSADASRSEFLQREQRIHSSIPGSPHIISYLGFDVTTEPSGNFYNLFLEYAPGGSLIDEVKKSGGKLCEPDIRARARDIVLGLAHLHSIKIAHCDVKGQNVLIGCDGRAKLADFGCARFVEGDDGRGHEFSGTPMFMAPEVARGEAQGMPADVWAAGCTVIEMATGRAPWPDATDAVSLLHRIAFSGDVPGAPAWMSEEGKDFLGKCLSREAGERWTADQLLAHPFLLNCEHDSGSGGKWSSPKSTLDRSFWDSLTSDSDDEGRNSFDHDSWANNPTAMDELFGHGANEPEWSWDEDWVTVRNDDESSVDDASPTPAGGDSSDFVHTATTSGGISISEEGFVFSTNYDVTDSISAVGSDNCDRKRDAVTSSDNCEHVTRCVGFLIGSLLLASFQLSICFFCHLPLL